MVTGAHDNTTDPGRPRPGLNHAEVTRLRDELAASSLPADIRAATTAALDEVLAHPATAKLTGDVRW